MIKYGSSKEEQAVTLSTIHYAKGKEYDTVYMIDVFDGIFPSRYESIDNEGLLLSDPMYQEERRLFYVAMTRAKNQLYLFSWPGRKSTFVREILPPQRSNNEKV